MLGTSVYRTLLSIRVEPHIVIFVIVIVIVLDVDGP